MAIRDVRDWFRRIADRHAYAHTPEQRAQMIEEMIEVVKAEVSERLKAKRKRRTSASPSILDALSTPADEEGK